MKSPPYDKAAPPGRTNPECVVWCILDGKAGHEAQSRGLVIALQKRLPVTCFEIQAPAKRQSLLEYASGKFPAGKHLPSPDLIIGAGNRTHLALMAASRSYGGKTIVLMQPTLPTFLFSLCLVPKHDLKRERKNILLTNGVLNTVQPATKADLKRGLFLIGGPSAHYDWDTDHLLEQVATLVNENPDIHWTLTTSRRTPADCARKLVELSHSNLEVIPVEKTSPGWVASMLQKCGVVWVSEDSVSMVYEALTAGAYTGLLKTPHGKSASRVRRSVMQLLEQQRVVYFSERDQLFKAGSKNKLTEADRCAEHIITHLLNART